MEYKIFSFGDDCIEWIAGKDKEDAIDCYKSLTDLDEDTPIKELTEKQSVEFKVFLEEPEWDEDNDCWKDNKSETFKFNVERRLSEGEKLPFCIASSEW